MSRDESLSNYHKTRSLSLVAGMLLDPRYAANNFRIERLLHLLIAECNGQQIPKTKDLHYWLNQYESVSSRRLMEDPPEDTFICRITTQWGDFRVYGGLWESYGFFLQRILNVVQTMPIKVAGNSLTRPIESLLKVSEEIARRNNARLNLIAKSQDKAIIIPPSMAELEQRSETLYFSKQDLAAMDCTVNDLHPFILLNQNHKKVEDHLHGLTHLLTRPMIQDGDRILVVLPTAITWSIRLYLFRWLKEHKIIEKFHENLVLEYLRFLTGLPAFGKYIYPQDPLVPPKVHDSYFLEFTAMIDMGRYLHTLVVVDTLNGLMNDGISQPPKKFAQQSDEVMKRIRAVRERISSREGFREGLSLVVMAGYGRARFIGMDPLADDWEVSGIGANDLETMAWTAGSDSKTIWKFVQYERKLEKMGIKINNVNGLLNFYGWWQECDHMLIPSDVRVGEGHTMLLIPTDCIGRVRRRAWVKVDHRSALYVDGSLKQIRKKNLSAYFTEDDNSMLYASIADVTQGKMVGCALTKRRPWWLTTMDSDTGLGREMIYRHWDAIHNWLEKIAIAIDHRFTGAKPGPVLFELDMSRLQSYERLSDYPVESQSGEIVGYLIENDTIKVRLNPPFLYLLHSPKNTSEAAVVKCFLLAFFEWAGIRCTDSMVEKLLKQIIPNERARYIHMFTTQNFREMLRVAVNSRYEDIDKSDISILKVGLGHFSSSGEKRIEGREECTRYLGRLVDHLYNLLREELKRYGKKDFVKRILLNIEGIAAERDQWNRTMSAVVNLRKNKQSVLDGKAKHFGALTAADIACRILIEIAVCECPLDGQIQMTSFDMSPMMAKAQMIFEMGNISDGIDKGEIAPAILIRSNGDVHTDQSFRLEVFHRLIKQYEEDSTEEAIESYEERFEELPEYEHSKNQLEDQFLQSVQAEFGVGVEDLRMFLHEIEEIGYEKESLVYSISQNELIKHAEVKNLIKESALKGSLHLLSLSPRERWEIIPEGYVKRDWYPWLYRRKLSLVMKPIVKLDDTENPEYLIAPGLCEMSVVYVLNLYRASEIEAERCRSVEMKQWIGDESDRRGHRFVVEAASVVRQLGYSVATEVLLSAIFPPEMLDKNYGDFDLIAWKINDNKVYLVECKKLLFAKTFKEIAEQLQEFKGLVRNGTDDRLRKHLNRIQVATKGKDYLMRYCKLAREIEIVTVVLFSNPVPVMYNQTRTDVKFLHIGHVKNYGLV